MKYIKLFEELHKEDDNDSQIKEIWGIDPYELNEIILSSCSEVSIWGEVKINFLILTTDKDDETEYTDIEYRMINGELELGSDNDCMKGIVDENDYTPAIEVFISIGNEEEFHKREELVEIIEDMLLESKSTYHLTWDEDKDDSMYLHFNKRMTDF